VLARLLALVGPTASPDLLWRIVVVLAAVTMTVGNVMALWQSNLRRLLACSSIAHAGYLLVGIAAAAAPSISPRLLTTGGLSATLFYLATYAIATIGVFGALTYLGHRWPEWTSGSGPRPPREEIATVDDLDGLSGTNPVAAFAIAVFLLSLAGIPPLPGFWGKLALAISALEVDGTAAIELGSRRAWFVGLAVMLVLNAAIAAAYYLRIIAAMYFKTTKRGVQADGGLSAGVAMLVCLVLVGLVTIRPRSLLSAASRAGESLVPHEAAPSASLPEPTDTIAAH
jgi:NADH-quinone oxidoreductase subunit N